MKSLVQVDGSSDELDQREAMQNSWNTGFHHWSNPVRPPLFNDEQVVRLASDQVHRMPAAGSNPECA